MNLPEISIRKPVTVLMITMIVVIFGIVSLTTIGLLVGITRYPSAWFVRGPLCGLLMMAPVTVISLATPGCGWG